MHVKDSEDIINDLEKLSSKVCFENFSSSTKVKKFTYNSTKTSNSVLFVSALDAQYNPTVFQTSPAKVLILNIKNHHKS